MQQKSRRNFLKAIGLGAAAFFSPASASCRSGSNLKRPNILFFLVDDMGWMDSTVYGSRYYETPNVDRLARRGMLFTNAYAANPLCSPTRASIMTGKYPCRLKITTPAGHLPPQPEQPLLRDSAAPWQKMVVPRSRRFLPLTEHTIAEVLKENIEAEKPGANKYTTCFMGKWHLGHEPWWPKKQGFDINIAGGHYPGPPSYFSPYKIKTLPDGPEGEYITDRLTCEAEKFLKEHREKPFFFCFWHYAVHAPFQGKEDLIKKYENKKDPRGKQDCPTMNAMLKSMDESLGRVLDTLDKLKLADNTIIIFTSDNGGNMYDRVKGTTPTNNFPLRNGKGSIYEGGVREPCIVVWPGVVKPDSECEEIISSIDFYPTMLEMAGLKNIKDQLIKEKSIDGESIVPLLKGTGRMGRKAHFCHYPHYIPATGNLPATSVRKGKWKLIRLYGEGVGRVNAFELYDLEKDIGESNNLAEGMPEKVRELDGLIDEHLKETGAIIPVLNPKYDPKVKRGQINSKPVAGWRPSGSCELSISQGALEVNSMGGDPYLHTRKVPHVSGPLVFKARFKSSAEGDGQVFWNTVKARNFHRSRSVIFSMKHDSKWHEISINLPVKDKMTAIRLDPGTGRGIIQIEWMRLQEPGGKVLKQWKF